MFDDHEWTIYISRATRLRKEGIKRNHEQAGMDIPLLMKWWPHAMNEITKHLNKPELLELRRTSYLMKQYCDKEFKVRKIQKKVYPTMGEIIEFSRSDPYYSWVIDDYRECEYKINLKKCICGGYEKNAKEYDPDCPGKDAHNYKLRRKQEDEELIKNTEINILLNPKLKDRIW